MNSKQARNFLLRTVLFAASFGGLVAGCDADSRAPESKERLAKAQAMFAERCKTAGETIRRKVENVEGIYILKLRPKGIKYGDQFALDDPYGSDLMGDGYIESFLRGSFQANSRDIPPDGPPRLGYHYVEAVDPKDGQRYRYTGRIEEPWQTNKAYLKGYTRFVLDRILAPDVGPRYGVTYDDVSTRGEREYWIAGSSLKVIDLQTDEVIAERLGYMIDFGQGNTSGGRSPWLFAADHACPKFGREFKGPTLMSVPASTSQSRQAQDFVEKVLVPKP